MASVAAPRRSIDPVRGVVGRHAKGRLAVGAASLALFLFLFFEALVRPSAPYDLWAMRVLQRPVQPTFSMLLVKVERLTDSIGAVVAWLAVLGVAVAVRRWAWVCVVALVPSGGVVNFVVADVVARARPHLDGTIRSSQNFEDRSFPSGHAMGAMMLYGLVFAAAGEVRSPVLRGTIRAACVVVIVASGYQRVWGGAHWPSDVLGGYALGGLMLACLLGVRAWLATNVTSWNWSALTSTAHATFADHRRRIWRAPRDGAVIQGRPDVRSDRWDGPVPTGEPETGHSLAPDPSHER